MPKFTFDESHLSGGNFKLLPEGEHKLDIVEARAKMSSTGNEMINLKLENDEGSATDNLVFTEKAFWKLSQFVKSMGVDLASGQEIDLEPEKLIGKAVTANISHEPDQKDPSKVWARVDGYTFAKKDQPF